MSECLVTLVQIISIWLSILSFICIFVLLVKYFDRLGASMLATIQKLFKLQIIPWRWNWWLSVVALTKFVVESCKVGVKWRNKVLRTMKRLDHCLILSMQPNFRLQVTWQSRFLLLYFQAFDIVFAGVWSWIGIRIFFII